MRLRVGGFAIRREVKIKLRSRLWMACLLALGRLEVYGRDLKRLAEDGDTELSAAESLRDFIFIWCGLNLSYWISH